MTGRPRFKPTAAQRSSVKLMKATGWSNERIAGLLGISRNTLESSLAAELQYGADSKKLEWLQNLERASKKGNASASKQLLDRHDLAATTRPNQPAAPEPDERPKEPKLGKKQEADRAAQEPDQSTDMGGLMARRMELAKKLN